MPNLTARTSRGSWLLVRSRDSHCWRSRRRFRAVATEDFGLSILSVMTLHGITVYTVMLALLIVYTSRTQFAAGAGSKAGREYHGGNLYGPVDLPRMVIVQHVLLRVGAVARF